MKTYTVEIKNGAGTIQTINPCHGISDKEWNSIGKYIPAEQIEGQERIISSKIGAKFIYPDGLKYSIPDGLYEMEKVEKPQWESFKPTGNANTTSRAFDKALTDYRPWRIIKLLDKQYYLTAGEKRKLMKWAKLLDK